MTLYDAGYQLVSVHFENAFPDSTYKNDVYCTPRRRRRYEAPAADMTFFPVDYQLRTTMLQGQKFHKGLKQSAVFDSYQPSLSKLQSRETYKTSRLRGALPPLPSLPVRTRRDLVAEELTPIIRTHSVVQPVALKYDLETQPRPYRAKFGADHDDAYQMHADFRSLRSDLRECQNKFASHRKLIDRYLDMNYFLKPNDDVQPVVSKKYDEVAQRIPYFWPEFRGAYSCYTKLNTMPTVPNYTPASRYSTGLRSSMTKSCIAPVTPVRPMGSRSGSLPPQAVLGQSARARVQNILNRSRRTMTPAV